MEISYAFLTSEVPLDHIFMTCDLTYYEVGSTHIFGPPPGSIVKLLKFGLYISPRTFPDFRVYISQASRIWGPSPNYFRLNYLTVLAVL